MIRTNASISQAEQNIEVSSGDVRTSYRQTYREIADQHVVETDVLEQLRGNIAQLEDLHGRLRFMMKEVGYLLKKN